MAKNKKIEKQTEALKQTIVYKKEKQTTDGHGYPCLSVSIRGFKKSANELLKEKIVQQNQTPALSPAGYKKVVHAKTAKIRKDRKGKSLLPFFAPFADLGGLCVNDTMKNTPRFLRPN